MTTLNIRIRALEHNIEIIKSLAADAQIIAVLKGNAYGLGLCKFATFLQARGIRHFAVTELADAIELREKGIFGEILLLTPLYHPEDITRAIKHDFMRADLGGYCRTLKSFLRPCASVHRYRLWALWFLMQQNLADWRHHQHCTCHDARAGHRNLFPFLRRMLQE